METYNDLDLGPAMPDIELVLSNYFIIPQYIQILCS